MPSRKRFPLAFPHASPEGEGTTGNRSVPLPYLVGAAVGAVGLGALPVGLAWAFLHPPRRLHHSNPQAYGGMDYERVRFKTPDDITIRGWWVPAPQDMTARAVVVVSHGYYGNRANMLPYLRFLHQAGFACLLYDFRAHGWSGGRMTSFGFKEPLDLQAAIDYATNRPDAQNVPLLLFGESMGAATSLLVAATEPQVRAVVSDSAFARFDSAVEGRMVSAFGPVVGNVLHPQARKHGERFLGIPAHTIAPEEALPQIAPRPVLLIQGGRDRLVVPENAQRLLAVAPGNAELWEVPEAAHVASVYARSQEYAQKVVAFYQEALQQLLQGNKPTAFQNKRELS